LKLLTKSIAEELLRNGRLSFEYAEEGKREPDFIPIAKLFTPDAQCTWLLSELDPNDPDIAFGLFDLGMGVPELGSVRISELEAIRGRLGLPVERDQYFTAHKTISAYADEARASGAIKA